MRTSYKILAEKYTDVLAEAQPQLEIFNYEKTTQQFIGFDNADKFITKVAILARDAGMYDKDIDFYRLQDKLTKEGYPSLAKAIDSALSVYFYEDDDYSKRRLTASALANRAQNYDIAYKTATYFFNKGQEEKRARIALQQNTGVHGIDLRDI